MKKMLITSLCLGLLFVYDRVYGTSLCAPTQSLALADSFGLPVDSPSGYYDAQGFLKYNTSFGKYHLGEDWNGNGGGSTDYGKPVLAIASGRVTFVSNLGGSWGKVAIIRHQLPDGMQINSLYAHLSRILIKEGDHVQRGCQVGEIGDAEGYYKGKAHLHLELRTDSALERIVGGGYVASLNETSTIGDYSDPTRFIQGRLLSSVSALSFGWNSVTSKFTSGANFNSGWLDYYGTRFSITDAVNANLVYYLVYQWVNGSWRTFDIRTGTFNPGDTYWIYSFANDVSLAFYGQYDLDQQAFQDIADTAATDSRLSSVGAGSVGKDFDSDVYWTWRWIDYRFNGWWTTRIYHITLKGDPLVRYTLYWDPSAGRWVGWNQAF